MWDFVILFLLIKSGFWPSSGSVRNDHIFENLNFSADLHLIKKFRRKNFEKSFAIVKCPIRKRHWHEFRRFWRLRSSLSFAQVCPKLFHCTYCCYNNFQFCKVIAARRNGDKLAGLVQEIQNQGGNSEYYSWGYWLIGCACQFHFITRNTEFL